DDDLPCLLGRAALLPLWLGGLHRAGRRRGRGRRRRGRLERQQVGALRLADEDLTAVGAADLFALGVVGQGEDRLAVRADGAKGHGVCVGRGGVGELLLERLRDWLC